MTASPTLSEPALPLWHRAVAAAGAGFVYLLIWVFGRRTTFEAAPWLRGPLGGPYIGDLPYEEVAAKEGLTLERDLREGGLLTRMSELHGPGFDARAVDPAVRDFYERTAEYRMEAWSQTYFPASVALWALVKVLSRKVNQLNFPIDALETARGVTSEIIDLRDARGRTRYRGWFRRLAGSGRVVYTGFYMIERVPLSKGPCVKVVFPMPSGNATVILEPRLDAEGRFELDSTGTGYGGAGFYRVQRAAGGGLRVWRIRSLRERFLLYRDPQGVLRCDHRVRFLGLPVLHLHYRLEPSARLGTEAGGA